MSLINDVLRDLEKREQAAPAAVQAAFGPTPAANGQSTLLWGYAAGVLFVLCALLFWWLWPAETQPAPNAPRASTEGLAPAVLPVQTASAAQSGELRGEVSNHLPNDLQTDLQNELQPESQPEPNAEARSAPQSDSDPAPAASVTTSEVTVHSSVAVRQPPVAVVAPAKPTTATTVTTAARIVPMPQMAGTATQKSSAGIQIRRAGGPSTASAPATDLVSLESVHHDLNQGLVQRAEHQLLSVLQVQPEHDDARLLLARIYLHQNRSHNALQLLQAGAGDAPQPEFDLLLAASLRETGQHARAAELYQRLTRQFPDSLQSLLGLALSQEAAGQWQAAAGNYRQLLDSHDPRIAQLARQRLRVVQQRALEATTAITVTAPTATTAPSPSQPSISERTSNP